jgi:DNA (cytosine-5)-methyltransferase 1
MATRNTNKKFTVVDLFSGCGGITHGLHQVKVQGYSYETLAAVDIWSAACDTLEVNYPTVDVIREGLSPKVIKGLFSKYKSQGVDLVVGGPPCQGFSTSGKRALDDPRNSLIKMYLNAIEALQPQAFLMENVVGFTTFQGGKIRKDVIEKAQSLGYTVYPSIVQASLYGVPQRRRRFVLIGVKSGQFQWPEFINSASGKPIKDDAKKHWLRERSGSELYVQEIPEDFLELTFEMATQDLPKVNAGCAAETYRKSRKPSNWFLDYVRKGSEKTLSGHVSSNHAEHLVEMMKELGQGQSAFERFEEGDRLRPTSGFSNSYTRIRADRPAPTITRNFTTPSSANCIHPTQARALTPREGARMQSFPDSYQFQGTSTEQRLQIGNAVPPLLAKALGEAIIKNLIATRK